LLAKGEIFSIPALEPKRPSANQNAFLDLVALTNQFRTIMTNLGDLPPPLRFAAPAKAIIAWRLSEWSSDGKTTNDWSKIGVGLENAQGRMGVVRKGSLMLELFEFAQVGRRGHVYYVDCFDGLDRRKVGSRSFYTAVSLGCL